jgi:hypothetical protein
MYFGHRRYLTMNIADDDFGVNEMYPGLFRMALIP